MVETPIRKIRIDSELWEAASKIADENHEPVSALVRRALIQYLKEHTS